MFFNCNIVKLKSCFLKTGQLLQKGLALPCVLYFGVEKGNLISETFMMYVNVNS